MRYDSDSDNERERESDSETDSDIDSDSDGPPHCIDSSGRLVDTDLLLCPLLLPLRQDDESVR